MKVYEPPAVYVDHMKRWRRPTRQPLTRWQWWMIAAAGAILGWMMGGCSGAGAALWNVSISW